MQAFADSLATRFDAAVQLTISQGRTGVEITRMASEPTVPASAAKRHRINDAIDLPAGRRATVSLSRLPTAAPFTSVEKSWLEILHAGCAWIYTSAANGAARRLADLSPREREALGHFLRGASEKEVAAFLGRSRHTVHSYVKRIYRTLGVHSRSELRALFREANGAASLLSEAGSLTTSDE